MSPVETLLAEVLDVHSAVMNEFVTVIATCDAEGCDWQWRGLSVAAAHRRHATHVAAEQAKALREYVAAIETHNSTPVTPENLRWAATHEALCRSWTFDVLNGLADLIGGAR